MSSVEFFHDFEQFDPRVQDYIKASLSSFIPRSYKVAYSNISEFFLPNWKERHAAWSLTGIKYRTEFAAGYANSYACGVSVTKTLVEQGRIIRREQTRVASAMYEFGGIEGVEKFLSSLTDQQKTQFLSDYGISTAQLLELVNNMKDSMQRGYRDSETAFASGPGLATDFFSKVVEMEDTARGKVYRPEDGYRGFVSPRALKRIRDRLEVHFANPEKHAVVEKYAQRLSPED